MTWDNGATDSTPRSSFTIKLLLTEVSQVGTILPRLLRLRILQLAWPMTASAVNICVRSLSGFLAHKIQIPVLKVATSVEASMEALLMVVPVLVTALVASE